MHDWVVAHVQGDEGFACKVREPIKDLVVISLDESTLLTIQVVKYENFGFAAITVGQDVGRLYAIL